MSVFHNNALIGASGQGGYQIERSLRLDSLSSAYLHRTPSVAGNQKKYTISLWVKRCGLLSSALDVSFLGAGDGTTWGISGVGAFGGALNNKIMIRNGGVTVGYWDVEFRDPSAWYHFVLAIDTDQATPANRNRLYVNGVERPAPTASLGLGAITSINSTFIHSIGTFNLQAGPTSFAGYYTNALITEYHFIDGSQLTPSTFGENDLITGVWKPKKVTGVTYGTNGFYLKFADNSNTTSTTLGKDSSGNGNNWSPVGFSVSPGIGNDSLIDTPTPYADGGNGRGNYCTWNQVEAGNSSITFANGNLQLTHADAVSQVARGTFAVSSGKWYWEVEATTAAGCGIGVIDQANAGTGLTTGVFLYGYASGNSYNNGSFTTYGATFTNGDIIGVALNKDANTLTFYKNGVSQGTFTSSLTTSAYQPAFSRTTGTPVCNANFGQRAFAYTPPSGFLALNTQNLPEPTIKKPSNYMDVVTYTGTGASLTPTSSLGFSPDFVWIKGRSGATDHAIYDAVRGVQLDLVSNSTAAETTQSQGLTAFNSNGFTIGTLAKVNTSTATYAAWCWDESATPGFDIVAFTAQATAATVAHSLGVAPKFIIMKDRDTAAYPWLIYHADVGIQKYLQFSTAGSTTASTAFSTAPTSTVFDPGTGVTTGNGYNRLVAYLWSEVAGFSKFGSYTGNGSSDGPFVFCGFKPRWLMIKRSDSAESWLITDTAREIFNPTDDVLWANLSNSEAANYTPQDVLSNGFKIRTSSTSTNASGGTYIFAAFAESPFKYSLAC